jgi:hypothetical protein
VISPDFGSTSTMLKFERTLEDGAVANTLPFAETPIPTSRKSSANAFTISRGGPTFSLDLKAFCATAGAAANTTAAKRRLLTLVLMDAHVVMDARIGDGGPLQNGLH